MNRFCIAATALALLLGGCSAPTEQSNSVLPETSSAPPTAAVSPTPSPAPTVATELAAPPTLPFGGDCSSVFTSKEMTAAVGRPMKLVSDVNRTVLFDELFVNASKGVLVCSWLRKGTEYDATATAYVFDEALVASPGDSVVCNATTYEDSEYEEEPRLPGVCFFDFVSGGLWASVSVSRSDGFDEAALRRGGEDLAELFSARATPSQRAGATSQPAGVWELPDGCATFAQVDYSGIAPKPVKIVGWEYERGQGEADGQAILEAASGKLSCDIRPKKNYDGGGYGNFFVLPGMAGVLGTAVPLEGELVDVEGADSARLFPYPNLYYLVTSGPNLIVANLYSPDGNDDAARALLSDLIATANAG